MALANMTQKETDNENREHCKSIANELENIYNGNMRTCPECGETVDRDWDSVGDKFLCPHCHAITETDDWETESLWDYFEDCLDIEYRIGSDRSLRGVCIMVAWGGPSIYIDTRSRQVELYWWGDNAKYPIDYDVCNEIDSIFEECYNMG